MWITVQQKPRFVAVSDTHVYWSTEEGKQIFRASKEGLSGPCVIATTEFTPWDLDVEGGWVYWRDGNISESTVGRVMKARDECDSQEVIELATEQGDPRYLVLHDDYVYFTVSVDGAIRRVPKEGGPVEEVFRSEQINGAYQDVDGLAVDARAVFWSSYDGNKVFRLAL